MKLIHKWLALGLSLGLSTGHAYSAGESEKTKATDAKKQDQAGQVQQSPVVLAEIWTVYIDRMDKEALTLTFPKGSAELSASDQVRLRELMPTWKTQKDLDKVIVAAWSDQAYPVEKGARLSDAARDLAERRAEKIENFIEAFTGADDVDTFSMAEKPNWFQKTFATDAAQIKGAANNRQVDSLNEDRIHKILDSKGGPSKAVIILKRDFKQQQQAS
ncbi:MAG TPA: hypothetical protein VE954_15765 [Oligoflexus sp.]|uniref:hypothetical protein n=1 Tax=Oligoflexus sp. TaxID=1971216 RepID=UPI002D3ED007|nr:hypothetical protein [Oligoflexus sp.]HYX34559.1 hypothetical protein [Oligoflexus sp.]